MKNLKRLEKVSVHIHFCEQNFVAHVLVWSVSQQPSITNTVLSQQHKERRNFGKKRY